MLWLEPDSARPSINQTITHVHINLFISSNAFPPSSSSRTRVIRDSWLVARGGRNTKYVCHLIALLPISVSSGQNAFNYLTGNWQLKRFNGPHA